MLGLVVACWAKVMGLLSALVAALLLALLLLVLLAARLVKVRVRELRLVRGADGLLIRRR